MNKEQIENIKYLIFNADVIGISSSDFFVSGSINKQLEEDLMLSLFHSDQMIDVIRRGCVGHFQRELNRWDNAPHCFVLKSIKSGHIKLLHSDPDDAIYGKRKWSRNINLENIEEIKIGIDEAKRMIKMKAFW